jgi:hypothetical protein
VRPELASSSSCRHAPRRSTGHNNTS